MVFFEINFRPTNLKNFLKAPLAPIYTNFKGLRVPKKRNVLVNIKKVPNSGFFDLFFFSKNCLRCKIFGQNGFCKC